MLFNSYIFILLFLPMALGGYFALNHIGKNKYAQIWLVGMSLWFYGYFNARYLLIICFSVIGNYFISRALYKYQGAKKKIIAGAGIGANIASIFYFKYFNFFLENINWIFGKEIPLLEIVLPLGISFFTFQQVSYLVDSYRGETKDYGFVEYALFVTFFPQLIAGPIVLHNEMIPQFRDESKQKFNEESFAHGLFIFAIGLFKKVLIADVLGQAVSWGFDEVWDLTTIEIIIVSLSYTLQIYFDFSGYCDMAIGIGKMFGITIPVNFNSPYKSLSIVEFWSRWHMSLTRFLRTYVYFPLGGSRKGTARTYVNIMIVFLLSGIWHGANWTYVVWGLLHGIAQCLNRAFSKVWDKIYPAIRLIATFAFVNVTWIIFRADSVTKAFSLIKKFFVWDYQSWELRQELVARFATVESEFIKKAFGALGVHINGFDILCMCLMILFGIVLVLFGKNTSEVKFETNIKTAVFTVILLVWGIMSLSGISTFLYFNF